MLLKRLRYSSEVILFKSFLKLFRILGVEKSSNLGSFLAGFIGRFFTANYVAKKNLALAFPDLAPNQIKEIISNMWDNLGRITGEFVHVCDMSSKELSEHIIISDETKKNIRNIKKNLKGGIIFSAHIGSWEVGPKAFLDNGIKVKSVYRPLNNQTIDEMTVSMRGIELIPKSIQGSKQIIKEVRDGNYVIIMADQKVSDGISVPFFHDEALTSASIAKLSIKYNIPLIPTRLIRIGKKFQFEMRVEKPIEFKSKETDNEEPYVALTKRINKVLEGWIRQYPSQWFWVHDRWKK